MNWSLWSRQIDAIVRLELRRYLLARRWVGLYLLALAPIALFAVRAVAVGSIDFSILQTTEMYARFYQLFVLRFGVFFSCAVIFSQLIRGEILEKTLHFYLLAPVRRSVVILGKFVAGLVASIVMFGMCTAGSFLLLYLPSSSFGAFFLSGNGIPHLARYLIVTMLACVGYGAVFMLTGLLFKNPAVPTAVLLGWESLSFAFPQTLQQFSLVRHLQSLLPVTVDRGIFAVLTEPSSPWVSIPMLILITAGVLMLSGWILSRAEVTYSAD